MEALGPYTTRSISRDRIYRATTPYMARVISRKHRAYPMVTATSRPRQRLPMDSPWNFSFSSRAAISVPPVVALSCSSRPQPMPVTMPP